jgi:hypothetical protein
MRKNRAPTEGEIACGEKKKEWWAELRDDPVRHAAYIEKLRKRPTVWNKGVPWDDNLREIYSKRPKPSAEAKIKMGAGRRGKPISDEHKAAISRYNREHPRKLQSYHRGEKHHNWGKPAPKGSGHSKGSYCKKGHYVRSTWELACANWFFDRNIEYTYEATLFDLGDGIRYRPDFYIPSMDLYVEVKGYYLEKDRIKHSRFRRSGHKLYVFGKEEFQLFQLIEWINLPYLEQLAS